jgi:hypothetical protein
VAKTFFCESCKQTFPEEGEPITHEDIFGSVKQSELSSICEDCYIKFKEWYERNLEQIKESESWPKQP